MGIRPRDRISRLVLVLVFVTFHWSPFGVPILIGMLAGPVASVYVVVYCWGSGQLRPLVQVVPVLAPSESVVCPEVVREQLVPLITLVFCCARWCQGSEGCPQMFSSTLDQGVEDLFGLDCCCFRNTYFSAIVCRHLVDLVFGIFCRI